MMGERLDTAHGEEGAEAEGHAGRIPHLDAGGVDSHGVSPCPPHSVGAASPFQPAAAQSRYACFQPGGIMTAPVPERRAMLVADPVERRNHVAGEFSRLGEHGVDEGPR